MKKVNLFKILLLMIVIFLLIHTPTPGQEEQEKVKEYVDVVSAEIFLRAQLKGQPVSGLTKESLTLFENGKPVDISSMVEVKRKIGIQEVGLEREKVTDSKPRLFFFYFWLQEAETKHQEALDYFFSNVFRPGDQVILASKNKALTVRDRSEIQPVTESFNKILKEEAALIDTDRRIIANQLESDCRDLRQKVKVAEGMQNAVNRNPGLAAMSGAQDRFKTEFSETINSVFNNYSLGIKNFKQKYLKSNETKLMQIASSLKDVPGEKWAIVFYQPPVFPTIDLNNEYIKIAFGQQTTRGGRTGSSVFNNDVFQQLKKIDNPESIKMIRQAYFNANATFFMISMAFQKKINVMSEFLTNEVVSSEWEATFREISIATGGKTVDGTKLQEAMTQISQREDIYYILTYTPSESDVTKRILSLKSSNRDIKLFHHERIDLADAKAMVLDTITYQHPSLNFKLKNYRMAYKDDQFQGKVEIKITAADPKGKIETVSKKIELSQEESLLSLNLGLDYEIKYMLTIEATDLNTQKTSVSTYNIRTPKMPNEMKEFIFEKEKPQMEQGPLGTVLNNAAGYCEKLKSAALRFFCQEKVTEQIMQKDYTPPIHRVRDVESESSNSGQDSRFIRWKKNIFLYDYQIILKDEKITENRTLLVEKRKKVNIKDAHLKTRFASEYSFYLPMVFSRENRHKYDFQLVKEMKLKGRKVMKINIDPKSEDDGTIAHGIAWVDEEDGSVLKFLVHPKSFKGAAKLKETALRKGYDLILTDEHQYYVQKNGIRFPSETLISERYIRNITNRSGEFENSRTYFTYSKYRFFDVGVDVTTEE